MYVLWTLQTLESHSTRPLYLDSFTEHNVFEAHLCGSRYQSPVPFYTWIEPPIECTYHNPSQPSELTYRSAMVNDVRCCYYCGSVCVSSSRIHSFQVYMQTSAEHNTALLLGFWEITMHCLPQSHNNLWGWGKDKTVLLCMKARALILTHAPEATSTSGTFSWTCSNLVLTNRQQRLTIDIHRSVHLHKLCTSQQ